MENTKSTRPTLGLRNLKTALAATLCAWGYLAIGRNPAFACIGAIFGMGGNMSDSKLHGGNRLFGTVIGGLLGMGLYAIYLQFCPEGGYHWALLPLLFLGVVVLILVSQRFWVGAVQPGGVVLCIILFNTTPGDFVSYSINRMVDTAVGVLVALLINFLLPRQRLEGWRSKVSWFRRMHQSDCAAESAENGDDYGDRRD